MANSYDDLSQALNLLKDENIEQRIKAVERISDIISDLTTEVIRVFESDSNRFLIAERLPRLGAITVEKLQHLFDETNDDEVKTLSALVLLKLGSITGTSWLLRGLERENQYMCLIARHLANANNLQAREKIVSYLENCALDRIHEITCMLGALLRFGESSIPQTLLDRFDQDNVPWQIKLLVKNLKK